ncbi:MAG: DUF3303 family protein [Ktedonobacteraceae bacterium]|nr:DUF3303 family protein [Ktedonobacteraceae bacterium]
MLWYCKFKWHADTTREQMARRVVQQHDAGANHPERIKGWYNLAGGGAGFLLVEADHPQELTAFLQPYMDLMDVDVHAIYPLNYDQEIQRLRQIAQQAVR